MTEENKPEIISSNIDNEKIWAIFAYILFIIPWLFAKNKSKFLKFHINQGAILFVVSFVGQVVAGALPRFMGHFLGYIINAFCIAFFVIGIMNVINKEEKTLPWIGEWFTFLK